MKKFNFFSLIFFTLFISHSIYPKTFFLKCDFFIFKISEPIVGFKKAYIIEKNKSSKIKEFEVTDSNYILKNIYPNQSKCNNKKCRVNILLEKSSEEKNYMSYKSIVSNEFCNIDGGNKCYKRKKGKNLESGYCSKIDNPDFNN
tara:strand:- start:46 stop:477 length:432 start_codon:yes stop_codon:yes gene_type:complete